jgi:hypothetical protein
MPRTFLYRRRFTAPLARSVFVPPTWACGPANWQEPFSISSAAATKTATSSATLTTQIASLAAGDILTVDAATYTGTFTVSASGTATSPIIIRSTELHQAVLTGKLDITGSYVYVVGLQFKETATRCLLLNGSYNRVSRCRFFRCGGQENASANGIIYIQNLVSNGDAYQIGPTMIQSWNIVDNCDFVLPRNCVYWQDHGMVGNQFVANTITGPYDITGGSETEMIKIGYGFGNEDTYTKVTHNRLVGLRGSPYTIGIKSARCTVAYNHLDVGGIMIRYGSYCDVAGNVLEDGELQMPGANHTIRQNWIRSLTNNGNGTGVLVFFSKGTDGGGTYNGTGGIPWFYMTTEGCTIEENVFIGGLDRTTPELDLIYAVGNGTAVWTSTNKPNANIIRSNTFMKVWDSYTAFGGGNSQFIDSVGLTGGVTTQNWVDACTWTSNRFASVVTANSGIAAAMPVTGIIGSNGNVAGLA